MHEELYLRITRKNRRTTFSKYRISKHDLAIESGRYGNVKSQQKKEFVSIVTNEILKQKSTWFLNVQNTKIYV